MLAIVNLKISLCSSTLIFFMQHLSSTGLISLTCAYSRTQAISNFTFACLLFFLSFDRTILSSFTKEQMSRYEAFRRSAIPKTEIKKVSTYCIILAFVNEEGSLNNGSFDNLDNDFFKNIAYNIEILKVNLSVC